MLQQDPSQFSIKVHGILGRSLVTRNWPRFFFIMYIYKKPKDHGNYRPVSLTSVPGKIMEKNSLGANEGQLKDSNSHQTRYH